MSFRMIDAPAMNAPLEEWEAFLRKVKAMPQDDEGVQLAVEEAKRHISEVKAEQDSAA